MTTPKIYDLTDIIEETSQSADELSNMVPEDVVLAAIRKETRWIVREKLPDIAAKIIREEIEKIKNGG